MTEKKDIIKAPVVEGLTIEPHGGDAGAKEDGPAGQQSGIGQFQNQSHSYQGRNADDVTNLMKNPEVQKDEQSNPPAKSERKPGNV